MGPLSQSEIAEEPVKESPLEVDYPCSDGVAMSETDFQAQAVIDARHFLRTHFRDRPEVYVSGNLFVYYEQGNRRARVSPDILVAFGVERRDRRTYRTWEEGKAPDFGLEVVSISTGRKDLTNKRDIYASLGVREYFLFDPTGDRMQPVLQGYRLDWGRYAPLPALGPLGVRSAVLGLDLWVDERRHLRMRDASTGENLPSAEESEAGRRRAEVQVIEAESRAEEPEARAVEEARNFTRVASSSRRVRSKSAARRVHPEHSATAGPRREHFRALPHTPSTCSVLSAKKSCPPLPPTTSLSNAYRHDNTGLGDASERSSGIKGLDLGLCCPCGLCRAERRMCPSAPGNAGLFQLRVST